jgi:hypothetical protein
MTLIAGIVSRSRDMPVPAEACAALRRLISRTPDDNIFEYRTDGAYLLKLDIGAFAEGSVAADSGRVTLVAGEPILEGGGRKRDVEALHRSFLSTGGDALTEASGAYCVVHYDDPLGQLCLATDKLGLRPLYYWAGDEFVVFAGALRILEDLDLVPKIMDVRAVTEMVGLGYALADRTPYAGVRLLRAAEAVRFGGFDERHEIYWNWDEISAVEQPEAKSPAELFSCFTTAVERRIGGDTATSAFLSGGLDSRCIVAALRDRGVQVHTYNFARPRTQDLVFGREFAREIGSIHTEVPKEAGDMVPDFSQLMADAIASSPNRAHWPERPRLVWSGEGGSVALGHVHLTEEMIGWMRAGERGRVISEYIARESAAVAPRLFRADVAHSINGLLERGILAELEGLNTEDDARAFYLFLLLNDQHRKLAKHFENIDLHRLEFQLPFFDSQFIAAILRVPLDQCLRHRLYVKWLQLFPAAVTAVPWQAYPGHEPCPVQVPQELAYQWAGTFQTAERSSRRRRESSQAAAMLRAGDFPSPVLSRANLALAAVIHRTGIRNYQYLLGPAGTFHHYFRKCGGRYVLPTGRE